MTIFKQIISIRYRDIGELMKRCETLVVTRDESKSTLKRVEAEIVREEDGLIAFKDVMNEKILKLRYTCCLNQDIVLTLAGTPTSSSSDM